MNCQAEEAGGKNTPRGDRLWKGFFFQVLIAKSSLLIHYLKGQKCARGATKPNSSVVQVLLNKCTIMNLEGWSSL